MRRITMSLTFFLVVLTLLALQHHLGTYTAGKASSTADDPGIYVGALHVLLFGTAAALGLLQCYRRAADSGGSYRPPTGPPVGRCKLLGG